MSRTHLLTSICSMALAGAGLAAAGAQEAADADVITVTASPIRDSQAAAISLKREADNVLDVISADTIGRFPDQNLADSLGRLPGIAIERDQGQARFINFRGAPFRWTAIAFDGIDVLGAENGRIPRFDSFPSVITSAVEAHKAITPDMPGEAVSGFVNIRTFNPFDREGLSVSVEAGAGEQELGGGDVGKYNARLSWSGEQFGFALFGSNNSREQVTDNRELDLEIDAGGTLTVNELDFRNYLVEREDNAYGGHLEFRPEGPVSRVFASTLYSEFIDREQRNQYVFDFVGGAGALGGTVSPGASGYAPLVLANRLLEYGEYHNSTWTSTAGLDGQFGDWFVEARLNYAETTNDTDLPIAYSAGGTAAAMFDVTDVDAPQLSVFQPFTQTALNPSTIAYGANLAYIIDMSLDTEAWKLRLDGERNLTLFGRDTDIRTGIQFDTREAVGNGASFSIGSFPSTVDIVSFDTGEAWATGFDNTIGGTYYDNIGLRNAWAAAAGGLGIPGAADQLIEIEEDILAAYAMATTHFDGGNIVYGARVEMTDYTTAGPDLAIAYSDDYVNVLPSVHVNFDLRDDLKFRVSASTGLSRPTYTELRASAAVDPTSRTVSGGNPTLDPETTWGFDASLEWYFAPASLLSAGAFYRHVDDVIYVDSTTIDGGVYVPAAAGEDWTLSGPVNGNEGELSGIELNFIGQATDLLPAPFDGFGVSANLTVLDSSFDTLSGNSFSLPGTSDVIYNASLFYEKAGFSARVNYQYRDAWLSTTENDSLAEYWDEQERVDASLRYVLPVTPGGAGVTLFANANNLTDAIDVRYAGTRATPNQVEGYGRRFLFGIRVDY